MTTLEPNIQNWSCSLNSWVHFTAQNPPHENMQGKIYKVVPKPIYQANIMIRFTY